jgi:hypothetical protein
LRPRQSIKVVLATAVETGGGACPGACSQTGRRLPWLLG